MPWNAKEEIVNKMSFIENWGSKLIVPMPEVTVHNSMKGKNANSPKSLAAVEKNDEHV